MCEEARGVAKGLELERVAGGVEDEESPAEAARRELTEELCLDFPRSVIALTMFSGVRRSVFTPRHPWPPEIYIVEKYFFASDFSSHGSRIELSNEHTEAVWLEYELAHDRLEYSDDRTGLWELHSRIAASDLPAEDP